MIDYVYSMKFKSGLEAAKLLAMIVDNYYIHMINGETYRRPDLTKTDGNNTMSPEKTNPLLSMLFNIDGKPIPASTLMKSNMPLFHKYESFDVSFERLRDEYDSTEFNSCVPFSASVVPDDEYDPAKFDGITSFLEEVICAGDERLYKQLTAWLAKIMQFPDTKMQMVPILYSAEEGAGKTTLTDLLIALIGIKSTDVSAGSIESLVNERREHLIGKKLCVVNEVREMKQSFAKNHEAFKSLTSDRYMDVRSLYCAKITIRNLIETIITTNNLASIPTGKNARRLQIFSLSTKYLQNKKYFGNLYDNYINNPDAVNQFYTYLMKHVEVKRGPMDEIVDSEAQQEFIEATKSPVAAFWMSIIKEQSGGESYFTKPEAYQRYQSWCERNGEQPCSSKSFGSQSKGIKGVEDVRNHDGRFWKVTRSD